MNQSVSASPGAVLALAVAAALAWLAGARGLGVVLFVVLIAYVIFRRPRPAAAEDLGSRVAFLERRVAELQRSLDDLRIARPAPERAAAPSPRPAPDPKRARPAPPPPPPPPPRVELPQTPRISLPKVSTADLLGAKALAFAGGVVTLLGVVFFFVLAVNRGWVGPGLRITCGGVASALVFGAGLWLQRRYETTYSALAAVGAGLAGGYATLLAAVSLYDLVSKPVALVVASAIAAVAVAVSLAWSAEIVAGFGLIGAMIVPATLVFQGGLQQIGTAFVAIVFAGAAVVALRERWFTLLQVAALVSVPQAVAQVAMADAPGAGIVTLATAFWLVYVAAGLSFQLRLGPGLAAAPASFLTGGAVFAGVAAALLYGQRDEGLQQGIALMVVASVYVALAAALFRRMRESATLLWALGLTAAAVGLAQALSGPSLTYAWAAEAAVLAWLSSRLRDVRLQLPALVYLGLALVHAIVFEASPDHLFEAMRRPAGGAPALVSVALAALVFAAVRRSPVDEVRSTGILRALDPAIDWLRAHGRALSAGVFSLAAVLAAYAVSLGILELAQSIGSGVEPAFEWGHVAITAVWSLAGLLAVASALRLRSDLGRVVAFAWLGATAAKAVAFDAISLEPTRYGISFVVVASALLLAGVARELTAREQLTEGGVAAIVTSFVLLLVGTFALVPANVGSVDGNGLVWVGVGTLYAAMGGAGLVRARDRELGTLLWTLGLAAVAVGAGLLLSGVWLVLAYALSAAALAVLSIAVDERRLQLASLAYLVLGAAWALVAEAPPSELVLARLHPGHGVPSVLLVVGATAVLAWALGWHERFRTQAAWAAGALAVYAASLSILEAVQHISPEQVQTDFQRGHTLVSAFWGVLALASLYAGLTRRRALLRGGGFVLFAISLGKLFLFDLPNLSSAQRALSFLAVGAVLLLGGFFYQRLSAQFDQQT